MRFFKKYVPLKDPRRNLINNIYFIHVPKTGGTSIARTLGINNYTHIKAWEVKASGNNNLLKENFSFGVVRNPYDRFISLYNYARMDISFYHDNLVQPVNQSKPRHLDYNLLKNASVEDCIRYLKKDLLKHDIQWNQWQPQYTWLYDKKGRRQLVNKIYKMENLGELCTDLQDLGCDIKSFPVLNPSKKSNYRKLIDPKSKKILDKLYKKDLDLFGYDF